jgi:tRNA threonylcarbamoyladenosine biosynthesis protein TsaB
MVTLAIDTSQPAGSVSLARDDVVVGTERFATPSSHLVALAGAVEALLAAVDASPRDLDRIAVVVGPGSFTGVRIGLSFAKGLHAAGGTPLVPIDSLRLLALPLLGTHRTVCAMIDARRGEVYAAVYERADAPADPSAAGVVLAPRAQAPDAFLAGIAAAPDAFVGSGVEKARDAIRRRFPKAALVPASEASPSTAFLAAIAGDMPALDPDAVRALEPLYLRPSGAERVRLRRHGADTPEPRDE